MNILGRPFVLGDPEQTEWIHKQFRKEDLQDKIIENINEVIDAIDDYVYEFNSTDAELQDTVKDIIRKLLYVSGAEWDEELEHVWNTTENLYVTWGENK